MKKNSLTRGQTIILSATAVPMVIFGALGAVGTYSNIMTVFDRQAMALGVVAAGEGATLVLALVLVGLTMLGQTSPAVVRLGLWVLPATASTVGVVVAPTLMEQVVYAITPMAMCVSAEGLGLLARRIVVFQTGVDMEVQRKNSEVMQKLSFQHARSLAHPDEKVRAKSEEKAWSLAKRVGTGDAALGASLIEVQRDRMTQGADSALVGMYSLSVPEVGPVRPDSVPEVGPVRPDSVPEVGPVRPDSVPEVGPVRPDSVPEVEAASELIQRHNVAAFVRGLLTETPDITDGLIRERVLKDFGQDTQPDRIRKAIVRARDRARRQSA